MQETKAAGRSQLPERVALYNPITKTAYDMCLVGPRECIFRKILEVQAGSGHKVKIARHIVESNVCEASLMRTFAVRLNHAEPIISLYKKHLMESRFTLRVDGEKVADGLPLWKVMDGNVKVRLPSGQEGLLFLALACVDGKAVKNYEIGYMLPNGSVIEAVLEGVPEASAPSTIEIGWTLGLYTTKLPLVEADLVES